MAESREGSPVTNLQKTVAAQNARAKAAERPSGFMDRLRGGFVYGHVESKYEEGRGGAC